MNDCKYCLTEEELENCEEWQDILSKTLTDAWGEKHFVDVYMFEDELRLNYGNDGDEDITKINYCPFCGRKLR